MRLRSSMRELRVLLDEVAEINWRHPSWWAMVAGVAALEQLPGRSDSTTEYITSNGGPRADTFLASALPALDLSERIGVAVAQARAAAVALEQLDGHYPNQPLLCCLDVRAPIVHRQRLRDAQTVAFATPTGVFTARLSPGGVRDVALVAELAAACLAPPLAPKELRPVVASASRPVCAAIAVSLFCEELTTVRHLHRRVWTAGGGPWLGLGFTDKLQVVTTSHTVVDGYAHAQIALRVFDASVVVNPSLHSAGARRILASMQPSPGPVLPMADPVGIATHTVSSSPRFPELVWATALTIEQFYRRGWTSLQRNRARFTPTLQIPIAPGERGDPERFRRRVVPGLISLRMRDGHVEPFVEFARRLPEMIAREARCDGVLTRIRNAVSHAPVSKLVARRWLSAGAAPKPWIPAVDVLAGRGCVSLFRFDKGKRPQSPVFGASAPALDATAADPRGGNVLTAVDTDVGLTLTVSGNGLTGTSAGAGEFLDELADNIGSLATARASSAGRDQR